MTGDSFLDMSFAFFTGLGLLLVGAANISLRRRSLAIRLLASAACIASMSVGAYGFTSDDSVSRGVAGVVAGIVAVSLFAGSAWLGAAVRSPGLRWGTIAVGGLAFAVVSVTRSEQLSIREAERHTEELERITSSPLTSTPERVYVATDLGRSVGIQEVVEPRDDAELKKLEEALLREPKIRDNVIRFQPGSDRSNCHGWVFTGGRYWLPGPEVNRILEDNRYQPQSSPQPGDLVVYRSGSAITHTALVRYVTPGLPVLVEGKWGCSGVYLHAVDKSAYGTEYTFYRSSRSGHALNGLDASEHRSAMATPDNSDDFTE